MILPQLIDAARIDGTSEELIYLVLRMQSLLGTAAGGRFGNSQRSACGGGGTSLITQSRAKTLTCLCWMPHQYPEDKKERMKQTHASAALTPERKGWCNN